jgi:hypothetical protein
MPVAGTKLIAILGMVLAVTILLVNSVTGHQESSVSASRPADHAEHTGTLVTLSSGTRAREAGLRPNPFGSPAASYLATRASTVSAAVYDLNTDQIWVTGRSRPQAEASVVKLDIIDTLLAQHTKHGGLSKNDRDLARLMIEDSDNDAATALWNSVGGARGIRSFNKDAGLVKTAPSSCVVCTGFPWPGWGLTTTIPADQIALLREIVQPGGLLTNAERSYALNLLENVTPGQRWGVTGGVPSQATVALKNGWLPLNQAGTDWQINSVGWISGMGRNYLIAVLTTGNSTESYGIDTIDGLSALVWKHLG